MSFSLKQLLFVVLIVCVGLAALMNADGRFVSECVSLATVAIIVFCAYSIWINSGEPRAFFVGFVCWSVLYSTLFCWRYDFRLDIGTDDALYLIAQALDREPRQTGQTDRPAAEPDLEDLFGPPAVSPLSQAPSYERFSSIGHNLFALLFGLIGGWVTVYFYRKRQRKLAQRT
jgi:hypothetical protein